MNPNNVWIVIANNKLVATHLNVEPDPEVAQCFAVALNTPVTVTNLGNPEITTEYTP